MCCIEGFKFCWARVRQPVWMATIANTAFVNWWLENTTPHVCLHARYTPPLCQPPPHRWTEPGRRARTAPVSGGGGSRLWVCLIKWCENAKRATRAFVNSTPKVVSFSEVHFEPRMKGTVLEHHNFDKLDQNRRFTTLPSRPLRIWRVR